jgi:predicted aminopeptidase
VDQRPDVETALEHLVAQAYRDGGVTHSEPLPLPTLFPPVLINLTAPPNVLVIAPRTELRVIDSSVLEPMDVAAQEQLETSADSTGVSSLVAPIGGLATYPSMVLDNDSPEQVLSAAAHEWLHQYLIFYPLGQGYWRSQETREINETTADLVGNEVGAGIARSIGVAQDQPTRAATQTRAGRSFDFRAFMRNARQQVEQMLAAGQVDEAETYMRAQRDELERHGYAIRKLNQAYFAMYGSYGNGYAASPANPIPGLLRQLRDQSGSLGEFLARVRGVTSVEELRKAVA